MRKKFRQSDIHPIIVLKSNELLTETAEAKILIDRLGNGEH